MDSFPVGDTVLGNEAAEEWRMCCIGECNLLLLADKGERHSLSKYA